MSLLRKELGDFNSIVCFKAAIPGMEEALGEKATAIALTTAGRARGKKLAEDLGLSSMSLDDAAAKLKQALGKDGTCLCIVKKMVSEGEIIKVYTAETVCSAGETMNSPRKCTFTLFLDIHANALLIYQGFIYANNSRHSFLRIPFVTFIFLNDLAIICSQDISICA